jgi:hypothetical protein
MFHGALTINPLHPSADVLDCKTECGAFVFLALHLHCALHAPDKLVGNRKPESVASVLSPCAFVALPEFLEDGLKPVFGDSDACVADKECHLATVDVRTYLNLSLLRECHGVGY